MKIGQTIGQPQLDQASGAKPGKPKGEPAFPPASAGTESVSISSLSTHLHALESRLTQGEGFDAARVEAIKQAIRSGGLQVNADVVADRLIQSVRDLVGK
jgi:negative regulator of flagellin synthesis FlgM